MTLRKMCDVEEDVCKIMKRKNLGGKTTPYMHNGLTLCMVTHDR